MAGGKVATPMSLIEFAASERRANCSVCQLPEECRLQIVEARRKKIPRETIFAWLEGVYDWVRDDDTYTAHQNGHHDAKLRALQ